MKIINEYGHKYLSLFNGNGSLQLINDWEQIFGDWNWYSMHFLHLYFEYEPMVGESYEFSFAILGLGFTFRYTGDLNPELQARIDESYAQYRKGFEDREEILKNRNQDI